jgi:hypothetical protein
MDLRAYPSAAAWLDDVSPLLSSAEPENNLLLGLAQRAVEEPEQFPDGLLFEHEKQGLDRFDEGVTAAGPIGSSARNPAIICLCYRRGRNRNSLRRPLLTDVFYCKTPLEVQVHWRASPA